MRVKAAPEFGGDLTGPNNSFNWMGDVFSDFSESAGKKAGFVTTTRVSICLMCWCDAALFMLQIFWKLGFTPPASVPDANAGANAY